MKRVQGRIVSCAGGRRARPVCLHALVALAWLASAGAAMAADDAGPTSAPSAAPARTDAQAARGRGDAGTAADGAPAPDWLPTLTATVKPVAVALGDPVTVTIKVRHDKTVSVTLPLRLELDPFSELSRGEHARELGAKGHIPRVERTFTLKVAAYELGEQILPPIEVTALGPGGELHTLKTTAVPLRIKSMMANEPKPKLKDVAPPVTVFQRDWLLLYILAGLGAATVIVIATLLINRRLRARRAAAKPPPPPTPAHVLALRALRELDVDALLAQGDHKQLYLQLSEIVRAYVGRRWEFDALEMTTTEINQALRQRALDAELRARLDSYFDSCDLVKFAKVRPDESTARGAVGEAEAIVRATMPQIPPTAQTPAGQDRSGPPAADAVAPVSTDTGQGAQ